MEFKELNLKGVFEITPEPHLDERGFFMRTYDIEMFKRNGINRKWVQENHSRSEKKGIIRGLHFQTEPYSETKLVRCIRGSVYDVAVDIRSNSPTFRKWVGLELSEYNKKILFLPRGIAHGFCTLTDVSEVVYKVDNFYSPLNETGIIWNDSDLAIDWPVTSPILSVKDQNNVTLRKFLEHK
jgi:dTDP-4-dehydrorhamnose 3,5-epimerase